MGKLQRTFTFLVLMYLLTVPSLPAQNENSHIFDVLINWTALPFFPIVLVQGQTIDFETGFYSPKPLTNVHWAVLKKLQPIFGESPVFITNYVEPQKIYPLKITVHIPDDLPPGYYFGQFFIMAHRDRGRDATKLEPMRITLPMQIHVVAAIH